MNKETITKILNTDSKVVIFDIDGTLKDLCKEHNEALQNTLKYYKVGSIRCRLISFINNVAMSIVKSGILPTNKLSQNILVVLYAIISMKAVTCFYKTYYKYYAEGLILFHGIKDMLQTLSKDKQVYFATINKQNYNLEKCGIKQENINYSMCMFKAYTYSKLIKRIRVDKKDVLIVGDNLFDDIFSANILKVKSILVNNYSSNFKSIFCKFLN